MAEDITTSEFISKLSVNSLPDNPAAHGWKAAQIKEKFFGPIYEGLKRLLKEIQQIDPSAGGGTETGDGCSCEITEERVQSLIDEALKDIDTDCSCEITEERVQELIDEALKGISGGSGVNIVQKTGTSETDVMSQKATTDAIKYSLPSFGTDPVDGSLIISGGNYNFTYFPSGGSGSSGGGCGCHGVGIQYVRWDSNYTTGWSSDSATVMLSEVSEGIYKAAFVIGFEGYCGGYPPINITFSGGRLSTSSVKDFLVLGEVPTDINLNINVYAPFVIELSTYSYTDFPLLYIEYEYNASDTPSVKINVQEIDYAWLNNGESW